jgi:hypothetical protein
MQINDNILYKQRLILYIFSLLVWLNMLRHELAGELACLERQKQDYLAGVKKPASTAHCDDFLVWFFYAVTTTAIAGRHNTYR